jgi:hypothetical protein
VWSTYSGVRNDGLLMHSTFWSSNCKAIKAQWLSYQRSKLLLHFKVFIKWYRGTLNCIFCCISAHWIYYLLVELVGINCITWRSWLTNDVIFYFYNFRCSILSFFGSDTISLVFYEIARLEAHSSSFYDVNYHFTHSFASLMICRPVGELFSIILYNLLINYFCKCCFRS